MVGRDSSDPSMLESGVLVAMLLIVRTMLASLPSIGEAEAAPCMTDMTVSLELAPPRAQVCLQLTRPLISATVSNYRTG